MDRKKEYKSIKVRKEDFETFTDMASVLGISKVEAFTKILLLMKVQMMSESLRLEINSKRVDPKN